MPILLTTFLTVISCTGTTDEQREKAASATIRPDNTKLIDRGKYLVKIAAVQK